MARSGTRFSDGHEPRTIRLSLANAAALADESARTGESENVIVNGILATHFASLPAVDSYVAEYAQNVDTVRDRYAEAIDRLSGKEP